ncbi:Ribokinase-like protein [Lipomyces arxii]|uniref:Ribokinase-like protein n=1 Tax=Lipomyces arxii TaxID=56418 RepID=UPI0034CF39B5
MEKRVLAISSHVVHGYVGNRASTLPLQLLGWDVDVLNTVNFSNHTGYRHIQGTRITGPEMRALFEGLKTNSLAEYDVVLTGYVPGAEAVAEAGKVVGELREQNSDLVWVLDPVMGDEDKLYVSEDVIPEYEKQISNATVITPNQFETELLSGMKLKTEDDVKIALGKLYEKFKVPNIIVSSAVLEHDATEFICAGQSVVAGETHQFYLRLPFIDAYFTGTGDLFSSMVADRYFHHMHTDCLVPLIPAVEEASAIIQAVLRRTADEVDKYNAKADAEAAATGIARPEKGTRERRVLDMKHGELRLIQSQDAFIHPVVSARALKWT